MIRGEYLLMMQDKCLTLALKEKAETREILKMAAKGFYETLRQSSIEELEEEVLIPNEN